MDDLCRRARLFAMWQHMKAGHEYGLLPYHFHCETVAAIAADFMPRDWWHTWYNNEPNRRAEIVLAACHCHDLGEDTGLSYSDIASVIGKEAADLVFCVTNEQGKNRREKAERTYPKIAANRLAVFVKLCDRLANRRSGGKSEMYDREYPEFRQVFYVDKEYKGLWSELDSQHNFQGPLVKSTA